jgi:hypothetical protein
MALKISLGATLTPSSDLSFDAILPIYGALESPFVGQQKRSRADWPYPPPFPRYGPSKTDKSIFDLENFSNFFPHSSYEGPQR